MVLSPLGRLAGRVSPVAIAAFALAVVLGTGGGAVAGVMITGKQIKNGTVTRADVKNGSLTGADVKNGSLTGVDARDGSLTGGDVKDGSLAAIDIADEARSWGAMANAETDNFTTRTYTPVVSKTLASPAGYLTITGTLYAQDDLSTDGLGYLLYSLKIDDKVIDTPIRILYYSGSGSGETGAITVSVPVTAGDHTVQLVVREAGTGSYLFGGELTVIYTASGSSSGLEFARSTPGRTANR